MVEAPGAFLCLGLTLAAMNYGTHRQIMTQEPRRQPEELPASPCGSAAAPVPMGRNKD